MKKWLPVVLLVVVVIVLVVVTVSRRDRSVTVETEEVKRRDLTSVVRASGTIQPKKKVNVSANAMGTVTHLAVIEGQRVNQGDRLFCAPA